MACLTTLETSAEEFYGLLHQLLDRTLISTVRVHTELSLRNETQNLLQRVTNKNAARAEVSAKSTRPVCVAALFADRMIESNEVSHSLLEILTKDSHVIVSA